MSESGASAGGAGDATSTPTAAPPEAGAEGRVEQEVKPGKPAKPAKEAAKEPPKSEEVLPGVMPKEPTDDFDKEVSKKLFGKDPDAEEGPAGDRKTRVAPPRGPDGRFLKSGEGAEPAVKPDLPPGAEPEAPKEPPKEKFKFGDVEFDDQKAAEHQFKTLRGMHKALEKRAADAEAERDYGYRAANEWQKENTRLQARIAELEAGKPTVQPGSGGDGADTGAEDITGGIDMDAFEYIATRGSLKQAGEYLAGEVIRLMNEKVIPGKLKEVEDRFTQAVQPFQDQAAQNQKVEAMTRTATQLSALQTLDGKTAFPELTDPQKVFDVGRIWAEEGGDEAALSDPRGLMRAIALYRLVTGMPSGEATPAAEPAAPELPVQPQAPGAGATVVASPAGGIERGPRQSPMAQELNKTTLIDPTLGFAVRGQH